MARLVAVTGSRGYVGSHLCNQLAADPVTRVIPILRDSVPDLTGNGDRKSTNVAANPFIGVSAVVHAAGLAHDRGASSDDFDKANRELTVRVAQAASDAGVSRFVFLSTIGVNGSVTSERPFRETDIPRPNGAYAQSKLDAESALLAMSEKSDMKVVILRPPLVVGSAAPGNFGALIKAVDRGYPLPLGLVTGNRRSYIGLSNLLSAIELSTRVSLEHSEVLLVADNSPISTTKLLRVVAHTRGRPSRLIPVPPNVLRMGARALRKTDLLERLVEDLVVDNARAKAVLGWDPVVDIAQEVVD